MCRVQDPQKIFMCAEAYDDGGVRGWRLEEEAQRCLVTYHSIGLPVDSFPHAAIRAIPKLPYHLVPAVGIWIC